MFMRSLVALLSLLLSGLVCASGIYRWVDEQGNVHFGDLPPAKGAEPVQLRHYQPASPAPGGPATAAEGTEPPGVGPYAALAINQPADGATVRSQSGKVGVVVRLEPELLEGHYLELRLDGLALGGPQTRSLLELQDVARGAHELRVAVFDADGVELGRSQAVRFYLRRSSPLEQERAEQEYQQWLTDLQQQREAEIERERREYRERQRRELEAEKARVEAQRRSDFEAKPGSSPRYDANYRPVPSTGTQPDRYTQQGPELASPARPVSSERREELQVYDPAAIPRQPAGESADFDPATAPRSAPASPYTGPGPNPTYAPSYTPPAPSSAQ
jgi:hypothetical protein